MQPTSFSLTNTSKRVVQARLRHVQAFEEGAFRTRVIASLRPAGRDKIATAPPRYGEHGDCALVYRDVWMNEAAVEGGPGATMHTGAILDGLRTFATGSLGL